MKRLYQILILFLFVYVTFAFGKDLYTTDEVSFTTTSEATDNTPLAQGAAILSAKHDLVDLSTGTVIKAQGSVAAEETAETTSAETSDPTAPSAPVTNTEVQQDPQDPTPEGFSLGYFLLGTTDSQAVFWGIFDSKTSTLQGEVHFYDHPELRRVGLGTYAPTSQDAGSLSLHFSDPANPQDPGLDWTGTYDNSGWTIVNTQNPEVSLSGRVFQAPY